MDDLARIKSALSDPRHVLDNLGLLSSRKTFTRQSRGFLICCPVHADRTPSCSVQTKDGVLLWKCHGCDADGDVFSLVQAVHGIGFAEAKAECARMAGVSVDDFRPTNYNNKPTIAAKVEEERTWPSLSEVDALWGSCVALDAFSEVGSWLHSRGLDADRIAGQDIGRELCEAVTVPRWASFRGESWFKTGHRLIVPMFDEIGVMRSVRGCRVIDGDSPKRLPPGGHKASGLVMACELGRAMLRGTFQPKQIVISEGEPDFFTLATMTGVAATARIGIVNGSWNKAISDRIPNGAKVCIRTDNDRTGDRYADEITTTLGTRCELFRRAE